MFVPGTSIQILDHLNPLGVSVHMETYNWNYAFANFFVILNFRITNNSSNTLDSLYLGYWTDAVVRNVNITQPGGSAFFNKGGNGYIDTLHLAYEFDAKGDTLYTQSYIGTKFLGSENKFGFQHPQLNPFLRGHYTTWQFNNSNDPIYFFPATPSPRFTAALRDRLTTALETPMTNTNTGNTASNTASTAGTRALHVTPYLTVRNAAAAIDFYVAALGAVELHRLVGDDGRIGHAQLQFGSSVVMLADEYPEFDVRGPESLGGSSCSLHLEVDDVDAAHALALTHGATEVRPVDDQFHGSRQGVVRDPFGHRWVLSTPTPGFDHLL